MNKNTILICMETLGIGGVETYVVNQASAIKEKGNEVVIAAQDGIYREKLEKKGIKCVNFEFKLENYYNYDKINKMSEIIDKYDIKEVHIHTLVSASVMFPICIMKNIPYVAYVHTGVSVIEETFEWFEGQSIILKENLKDFFKYAYKIIIINEKIREYITKKYQIKDNKKILYIRNSINFEEYKNKKDINEIKNVLLLGRISETQYESVKNGILLFKELNKLYEGQLVLKIAGDGDKKEAIEKYVKNEDVDKVEFLGAISNVKEEIENSQLVIGVGRCILEAIAMKRIAVISAYLAMKTFVNDKNINIELDENFGGKQLEKTDIKDLARKIKELKTEEIQKIVNSNYEFIREKLDINKNIYMCDINDYNYNIGEDLYKILIKTDDIVGNKLKKQ